MLNILHGRPGEDGTIQGVLETLGIPYSHSGVLSSSLAMQKDLAKIVMATAGVPVAEGLTCPLPRWRRRIRWRPPYVIKPVADGSSVGVFIVTAEHPIPRRSCFGRIGAMAISCLVRKIHCRKGAHLRRHQRGTDRA